MESDKSDYLAAAESTEPTTGPAKRRAPGEAGAVAEAGGTGEMKEAESVLLREAGTGQDLLAALTPSPRSSLYAKRKARVRRFKAVIEE